MEGLAEKYALLPHCRFGSAVRAATWDEGRARWTLELEAGEAIEADLFQRTANWVLPKPDDPFSEQQLEQFRTDPNAALAVRQEIFERVDGGMTFDDPVRLAEMEAAGLAAIAGVEDPELRRKLRPQHPFGCKRPLLSNNYYAAFNRPNLELVTDAIERITKDAVVSVDGKTRRSAHRPGLDRSPAPADAALQRRDPAGHRTRRGLAGELQRLLPLAERSRGDTVAALDERVREADDHPGRRRLRGRSPVAACAQDPGSCGFRDAAPICRQPTPRPHRPDPRLRRHTALRRRL